MSCRHQAISNQCTNISTYRHQMYTMKLGRWSWGIWHHDLSLHKYNTSWWSWPYLCYLSHTEPQSTGNLHWCCWIIQHDKVISGCQLDMGLVLDERDPGTCHQAGIRHLGSSVMKALKISKFVQNYFGQHSHMNDVTINLSLAPAAVLSVHVQSLWWIYLQMFMTIKQNAFELINSMKINHCETGSWFNVSYCYNLP